MSWKKRRIEENVKKKENENIGTQVLERIQRRNKGVEKKNELLQKLKSQGKIKVKGKDKDWINQRRLNWRRYRDTNETLLDDTINVTDIVEDSVGEKLDVRIRPSKIKVIDKTCNKNDENNLETCDDVLEYVRKLYKSDYESDTKKCMIDEKLKEKECKIDEKCMIDKKLKESDTKLGMIDEKLKEKECNKKDVTSETDTQIVELNDVKIDSEDKVYDTYNLQYDNVNVFDICEKNEVKIVVNKSKKWGVTSKKSPKKSPDKKPSSDIKKILDRVRIKKKSRVESDTENGLKTEEIIAPEVNEKSLKRTTGFNSRCQFLEKFRPNAEVYQKSPEKVDILQVQIRPYWEPNFDINLPGDGLDKIKANPESNITTVGLENDNLKCVKKSEKSVNFESSIPGSLENLALIKSSDKFRIREGRLSPPVTSLPSLLPAHSGQKRISFIKDTLVGLPNPTSTMDKGGTLSSKRRNIRRKWRTTGESLSPGNTVPIKNFFRSVPAIAKEPTGKRKIETEEIEKSKKPRVGTRTMNL